MKFTVTDVWGVTVIATFSTWDQHVLKNHPEVAGHEQSAYDAIETPDLVLQGNTNSTKVFYKLMARGFQKGQNIAVVVQYRRQKQSRVGFLNTAYFTGTPPSNKAILWRKP
jgi:hypothetical protein